jgi:hypothetical protein
LTELDIISNIGTSGSGRSNRISNVHPLDRNNCNHFLNSQNKSGLTQNIYHIQAFKPAFVGILRFLLENGASSNFADNQGLTPK